MKVMWLPGSEVWSMHKLNPRPAQPHRLTDCFGISLFSIKQLCFILTVLFCFVFCFVFCLFSLHGLTLFQPVYAWWLQDRRPWRRKKQPEESRATKLWVVTTISSRLVHWMVGTFRILGSSAIPLCGKNPTSLLMGHGIFAAWKWANHSSFSVTQ